MLTHLHSDHSLGLVDEAGQGGVSQGRADHARGRGRVLARPRAAARRFRAHRSRTPRRSARVTAPYRDRIRRIKDGEVLPGITAMLRPGHTPGHTNWLIQSGGERLLIWGDIVHLASVQMARPEAHAGLRRRYQIWRAPPASGCSPMGRERTARASPARTSGSRLWPRGARRRRATRSSLSKAPPPSASPLSRTAAASAPPSPPACCPA